jgi:hypothetical protein
MNIAGFFMRDILAMHCIGEKAALPKPSSTTFRRPGEDGRRQLDSLKEKSAFDAADSDRAKCYRDNEETIFTRRRSLLATVKCLNMHMRNNAAETIMVDYRLTY